MVYLPSISYNISIEVENTYLFTPDKNMKEKSSSERVDHSKKWVSRPERHRPFTPFEVKERAEEFVKYLAEEVGIQVEIVWISGSANTDNLAVVTSFWDLKVPYNDIFKVKLLYRIKHKYHIRDLPKIPNSEKKSILRDYLHGEAHQKGGWREPMCTLSQIEWYSKVSGLSIATAKKMIAEAKTAYYNQHAAERVSGYKIAAGMITIGIIILCLWGRWFYAPIYGLFFTGSGLAFLIFAVTRRKRPQFKKRNRLSG